MKKLVHNDRGETLIEVLASILIAVLSVTFLFSCVITSSQMDTDAETLDESHYPGLTAADAQSPGPVDSAIVAIGRVDSSPDSGYPNVTPVPAEATAATVDIYGSAEGWMYSYRGKRP